MRIKLGAKTSLNTAIALKEILSIGINWQDIEQSDRVQKGIEVKLRFSMGKSIFVFYVQAVVFTYVNVIHCSLCVFFGLLYIHSNIMMTQNKAVNRFFYNFLLVVVRRS